MQKPDNHRQVVVTGLGVVSSIGIGMEEFWPNILSGKSGISEVGLFDTSKQNRHFAGEIKNFKAEDYITPRMAKFMGRTSSFAIAASELALKDAGLKKFQIKNKEVPVIIGVTIPEGNTVDVSMLHLFEKNIDNITKQYLLNIFSPSISRNTGYYFGLKGENMLIPNACAAGNYSIAYAYELIKTGKADIAIAGGAEALSRIAFQGFQRLYAMSPELCTPFNKDRKGMILGEGSGILVLESAQHAKNRQAQVYAGVSGYGFSCDAHHISIPNREGVKKAILKALNNSGLKPGDIDYISAHGTGTGANDKEESKAINEIFERKLPVSSIKSMLGHCMGAASSIEAAVCCMAIKEGIVPPTINYTTPDPDCDIDCVPNQSRRIKVNHALNNGFAFGGNNCCTIFSSI